MAGRSLSERFGGSTPAVGRRLAGGEASARLGSTEAPIFLMAEQSFVVPRQGPAPVAAPCEGHGRAHGPAMPGLGLAGGVGVAGALGALSLRRRARNRLARKARQVRVEVPEVQDVEKGLGLTGLEPEKLMAQAGHVAKDLEKAVSRWAKPEVLQRDVTHAAEQAVKEATAMLPSELKPALKELTSKVEAILPKDLAKLAVHLPPEISALLAHPEVLDPVKIPAGVARDHYRSTSCKFCQCGGTLPWYGSHHGRQRPHSTLHGRSGDHARDIIQHTPCSIHHISQCYTPQCTERSIPQSVRV